MLGMEAKFDVNLDELQPRHALQAIDDNRHCRAQSDPVYVIAQKTLIQVLLKAVANSPYPVDSLQAHSFVNSVDGYSD